MTSTRIEHDLLGDREVPADAYWGVHSLRAVENFPITGTTIGQYPHLVRGLALVKAAAAEANHELGLLDTGDTTRLCRHVPKLRTVHYTTSSWSTSSREVRVRPRT